VYHQAPPGVRVEGGVSVGEARLPYEFSLRRRLNGEAERELARRRSRRAEEV